MVLEKSYPLERVAKLLGARLIGPVEGEICGINTLQDATHDELSFLANRQYLSQLTETDAAAVLLDEDSASRRDPSASWAALVVENPYLAFARATALFERRPEQEGGVHPSAQLADGVKLGRDVRIGPNCVVGSGCELGDGVVLGPGCVLEAHCCVGADSRLAAQVFLAYDSILGARCLIHPGVVIGSDGFGHAEQADGRWMKIAQLGGVRIGDDVEIGANSTVDRGALQPTVIEDGVKIDNQVQIAHNVVIGAHSAIAGCVGIAGSTRIGRGCKIGGAVGIIGHLTIADGTVITPMTSVISSIEKAGVYASSPDAMPKTHWHRAFVVVRKLDAWAKRLRRIERHLNLKD